MSSRLADSSAVYRSTPRQKAITGTTTNERLFANSCGRATFDWRRRTARTFSSARIKPSSAKTESEEHPEKRSQINNSPPRRSSACPPGQLRRWFRGSRIKPRTSAVATIRRPMPHSDRVVHLVFDRMRRCAKKRDLLHFQIDIAINEIIRENAAGGQKSAILVQRFQGLIEA